MSPRLLLTLLVLTALAGCASGNGSTTAYGELGTEISHSRSSQ